MAALQQVAANITAAGGVTPWLKLNYWERPFDTSLLLQTDTGANFTFFLDYIPDDMSNGSSRQVSMSQTTTVITVTDSGPPIPISMGGNLGHGLLVGDVVNLVDGPTPGIYPVASITSATVYTLTSTVSQTVALQQCDAVAGRVVTAGSTNDHILSALGTTALAVGRYAFTVGSPIFAARLRCSVFTGAGVARLVALQGAR